MLKINGSNIGQIKINGFNIKLAKINNQVVFGDVKYTLTYSSYTYKFSGIDSGKYSIKYANGNTILEDYDSIAEITGTSGTYNSLINLNIAPKDVTKVVLVKDNEIKASINLPSDFEKITDTPLYSVGLLSDTHIDGDGTDTADSINDLKKALTLFKNKNVSFIAHCGDVTEDNRTSDYTAFSNAIADNTIPLKTIAGNHDSYSKLEEITGNSLYYEHVVGNDVYLFLGAYKTTNRVEPFSTEELSWLETKLSSYTNKRVFLFFHYYCSPVGNANNLDNDSLANTGQALTFRNLMNTYKNNVVYFSGHSHLTYKLQELVSTANVSLATDKMPIRVHIPSTGRPRILSDGTITHNYVGSECAIMDVYSDYIVIKGYDLSLNKILPIAMYKIPIAGGTGSGGSGGSGDTGGISNPSDTALTQQYSSSHEATPNIANPPTGAYNWKYAPRINPDGSFPNSTWNAFGHWMTTYKIEGASYYDNVGLLLQNPKAWIWNTSTHSWDVLSSDFEWGSWYLEDFYDDGNSTIANSITWEVGASGNHSTWVKIKQDSTTQGRCFHPWGYQKNWRSNSAWSNNGQPYIVTKIDFKLVKYDENGIDNLDNAQLVVNSGGDWWSDVGAVWQPDWSTNRDMCVGKYIKATRELKRAWATNLPSSWSYGLPTDDDSSGGGSTGGSGSGGSGGSGGSSGGSGGTTPQNQFDFSQENAIEYGSYGDLRTPVISRAGYSKVTITTEVAGYIGIIMFSNETTIMASFDDNYRATGTFSITIPTDACTYVAVKFAPSMIGHISAQLEV